MPPLTLGKLPPELLAKYLLRMSGLPSRDLVVRPAVGLDFGVVKAGRMYLVVSSDPVTGTGERVGWHAVIVTANDIATSGNRPAFMQAVILLSEDSSEEDVAELTSQMNEAAKGLGISIVGGHTELTPGLKRPIVVTTGFAFARRFITAAGARPGDSLLMTKSAGLEGTAILGSDPGLVRDPKVRRKARELFEGMSIVEEAAGAYGAGGVHAMHDCTEGGVLGAIYEMAAASRVGFEVWEDRIPLTEVTRLVCSSLRVDPLRLIGSGSVLIAVEKEAEDRVSAAVEAAGSRASVIGEFTNGKKMLNLRDGRVEVKTAPVDELWRLRGVRYGLGPR
jgi:hydrogenase expression/formation protein HypE